MESLLYLSLIKRFNSQRSFIPVGGSSENLSIDLRISVSSLKSLEDTTLLDMLDFLELISGQKPKIYAASDRYIGSTKKFFVSCGVHFSKGMLVNFLHYMSVCSFPSYIRRYGRVLREPGCSTYTFCFKDFFLFPNFKGKPFSGNILLTISGDSSSFLSTFLRYWKFPVYFRQEQEK